MYINSLLYDCSRLESNVHSVLLVQNKSESASGGPTVKLNRLTTKPAQSQDDDAGDT